MAIQDPRPIPGPVGAIPSEWMEEFEEFEAAAQRPLKTRIRYPFVGKGDGKGDGKGVARQRLGLDLISNLISIQR